MLDCILDFFRHPIFTLLGGFLTVVWLFALLYTIYLVIKGVLPVLYRLGISLSKKKIAIFAENDDFNNLKSVLIDSQLFKEKNILHIDSKSHGRAEAASLLLLHWKSCQGDLSTILHLKKDAQDLIVYAPTEDGRIDTASMNDISKHRNVIVVNFRGRLINDVLVCMMTSRRSQ